MTHPIGDRFGGEREPEPSSVIRASVEIAAPPDVVFHALADPRELAAWLGDMRSSDALDGSPSESSHDRASDDRGDAPFPSFPPSTRAGNVHWRAHVRAPDGTPGTVWGELLRIIPPHSLSTTWSASWNRFALDEVTFELVPIDVAGGVGTRVTVTHRRRAGAPARQATIASARAAADAESDTWAVLLARLAAYVVTTNALAHWGIPSGGDLTQAFDTLHRRVVDIHLGESA